MIAYAIYVIPVARWFAFLVAGLAIDIGLSIPSISLLYSSLDSSTLSKNQKVAYRSLQGIGREITAQVKPRAVVTFSAHWQGRHDGVLVNTAEITDLIYE
ncbi:uncharacterized protein IWZ02DRAFT_369408 [Phyllosticta citriasiana]|uniref:uncharacterized protein n=1 Tax=Phyllosticta citriasiana TaxID=595635 RepID=UPI0030FDECEF